MMKRVRFGWAISTTAALAASCGAPPAPRPEPAGQPTAPATSAASGTAVAVAAPFVHRQHAPIPQRPPPPIVTTPMKGEPTEVALAEARLETTTCEKATKEDVEARVKEMRVAMDQSFRSWRASRSSCWERPRRRAMPTVSESSGGSFAPPPAQTVTPASPPAARADATSTTKGAAKAQRASGTNNQVAGVDEADIVKNDGRYVYFAANGALRIAEALHPRVVSVTKLSGTARNLFIEGDRAVVYTSDGAVKPPCTYGYDCMFGGDGTTTKVSVYDIKNRVDPKLVRQIELSGSFIAARRIGGAVHTVVADGDQPGPRYATWPNDFDMCNTPEPVARKKFAALQAENERKIRAKTTDFPTLREKGADKVMCDGLMQTRIHDGGAFTSVVSFDMHDDRTPPTTATMRSRPGAVFASENGLYLSVVHRQDGHAKKGWYSFYSSVDEVSEIHKFRIGATPRETKYVGSGVVPGHVLNQFAMDEWSGYLRVATTRGHVPDPNAESVVSILAQGERGNLARVGAIGKIAPGEDIRSVRFDGDRGYIVTFKKTDPLFVMDLYHPAHPAILGELKIPGFSTYIHRIDPEHLLSIGFDANDHGSFAYFDGVILQLFDVKNPTDPRLVHKEKLGSRGSSSQAATDHLAFNYFADQGLLAVPMTICDGGGDGRNGTELSFSGLLVYDVDTEKGFTRLGGIDHGTAGVDCSTWWSNANSAVKRSIFLDDLVYSITSDQAKVQRLGHLGVDVANLSLTP